MKQRTVLTLFVASFVIFAMALFILAQLTSLSANPVSDFHQSEIWGGNVAATTLLLVVLVISLVFSFFTRDYFGQHNHLVKRNTWIRLGATLLIFIFWIILMANKDERLTVAIMTWLSFATLVFTTYYEVRSLVTLYWSK